MKEHKQITEDNVSSDDDALPMLRIVTMNSVDTSKILVPLHINNKSCKMELDTGAAVSTMSKYQFTRLMPNDTIHPTAVKLRTYTGEMRGSRSRS